MKKLRFKKENALSLRKTLRKRNSLQRINLKLLDLWSNKQKKP